MAQYHFHLHECGTVTPDYEGSELAGLEEVREHATWSARELMSAEIKEGRLCLACSIEVVGRDGEAVMTVPFRETVTVTGIRQA